MTYPKIGETANIPEQEKTIHIMMIKTTSFALVAEANDDGHLFAFLKADGGEGWNDLDAEAMIRDNWIPMEFNTPVKFDKALEIANEYRTKTQILENQVKEYQNYAEKLKSLFKVL